MQLDCTVISDGELLLRAGSIDWPGSVAWDEDDNALHSCMFKLNDRLPRSLSRSMQFSSINQSVARMSSRPLLCATQRRYVRGSYRVSIRPSVLEHISFFLSLQCCKLLGS